jgi:hypothetical protein
VHEELLANDRELHDLASVSDQVPTVEARVGAWTRWKNVLGLGMQIGLLEGKWQEGDLFVWLA